MENVTAAGSNQSNINRIYIKDKFINFRDESYCHTITVQKLSPYCQKNVSIFRDKHYINLQFTHIITML